jgi:hypothetical protein
MAFEVCERTLEIGAGLRPEPHVARGLERLQERGDRSAER